MNLPAARRSACFGLLFVVSLALVGCEDETSRNPCADDANCADDEVCLPDGLCLARELVPRVGGKVGEECFVRGGQAWGCEEGISCRQGFCLDGGGAGGAGGGGGGGADPTCTPSHELGQPALFGGVQEAVADGPDAVMLRWFAAASPGTPGDQVVYRIWVATTGELDLSVTPTHEVTGVTEYRVTGLTTDTPYFFVVRSRTLEGAIDCNHKELQATPAAPSECVAYEPELKALLDARCIGCHVGDAAPAALHLDSYEGLLAGSSAGPVLLSCQPDASLIFQKVSMETPPRGARMPFGGPYLSESEQQLVARFIAGGARRSCEEPSPCGDAVPPVFAGLESATPQEGGARLCWQPAVDETSDASAIVYDVWEAGTSGGQALDGPPVASSAAGETCVDRAGLTPGAPYCWIVRARDEAGNRDDNTLELCAEVPSATCIDWDAVIGPLLQQRCSGCHSGGAPSAGLNVTTYEGVLAGGVTGDEVIACRPDDSLLWSKVSMETPRVGARMPFGGPYLEQPQLDAIHEWIATGARRSCLDADPCGDAVPPTFGGVASATLTPDGTAATLCWAPATDDATAEDAILYEAWRATAAGAQDFSSPPEAVQQGGTCQDVGGLLPGTTYCFVVRARDGAGNRDGNLAEACVTTPEAACIEYASMIQPILDGWCTRCHAGATPPAGLRLGTHADVLAGGQTGGEVVACRPQDSLLWKKIALSSPGVGVRMPADGPPYLDDASIRTIERWIAEGARTSCSEPDVCSDAVPPTFAGVTSATLSPEGTGAQLCWSAGSDDLTAQGALRYDVFQAGAPGAQDFTATPTETTAPGALCSDVAGLLPETEYCWVVRARDGASNRDGNTVEQCLTTPAVACIDYATMVQPILDANCTRCHAGAAPPAGLLLTTHANVLAGGNTGGEITACRPDESLLWLKVSLEAPPVGGRMPADGPPYLDGAQLALLQRWISEGARASCAEADPCSDAVPPTFGGVTSATLSADGTGAELCWSAGADDLTAPAALRYDVWQSAGAGLQDFTSPPTESSAAGALCQTVTGLLPETEYCWVVRARDGASNRDGNVIEECLTTPAVACVDYATMIQPILDGSCTRCHAGLTPPQGLVLDGHAGVLAGGNTGNEVLACRPLESLLWQKIALDAPPVGGRMPADGPPYLAAAEVALVERWISEGARQSCAEADPCSDATPPTFAGVQSVTLNGPGTGAAVCWAPGADDTTAVAALVYEVYQAGAPGAQDFTSTPRAVTGAGVTCETVQGLLPGAQYCFVVRARDAASNRDGNLVEQCVTTPAAACIDYATMVQPILDANCTRCHSGANPPQALALTSRAGVLAGGNTGQEVLACRPQDSLLWQKIALSSPPVGARMPLDGPPFLDAASLTTIERWIAEGARASCAEVDPCSDVTAPLFAGVTSATLGADPTTAQVCWSAATDDLTAPAAILYDVWQATTPGGQSFSSAPAAVTAPGATCETMTGLLPGAQYCFVARARDAASNRDSNFAEACVTTPAAACIDYASMVQPILDANCTRCHSGANPPQALSLTSRAGVIAGGATGNEVLACRPQDSLLWKKIALASPPVGARMPLDGPPFLDAASVTTIERWIAEGARSDCGQPDPCSDVTPPAFAGAASATLGADPTTAQLCWSAGADDTTPAAALLYELYQATTPGGQDFAGTPRAVTGPGATCESVAGLLPGQQYCFVVRARDAASNTDTNVVERCVTTPAAACIDYASMVQPILDTNCTRCHSGATPPAGLSLTTRTGVLAGGNTGNEVLACRPADSLLYKKITQASPPVGARMPLDGPPYLDAGSVATIEQWIAEGARASCAEPDPCSDVTPPVFAGNTSATLTPDGAGATVCWAAATDDLTPPGALVYELFQAGAPGAQNFSSTPTAVTAPGATCETVGGLLPDQSYCFVTRARDGASNVDANVTERCVTTPPVACLDYVSMIQPILDTNCTRCHSGFTPPAGLSLTSHAGVIAGGNTGNEVIACRPQESLLWKKISMASPPVGVRMPADGPPFLDASSIASIERWIAEGARASCALPDPCSDVTPPTFAGATSATLTADNAGAHVCWAPGSDDATPVGGLVYELYGGVGPGGQDFTAAPTETTAAGEVCATVAGLLPETQYCFIARARDGAGNRDENLVERCVTTPAAACIDYATMIQPIFNANCTRCHSGANPPNALSLTSHAGTIAGGRTGGEVIACRPQDSLLWKKISMANPPVGGRMPADGPPYLDAATIALIERWISEGGRASCATPDPCSDATPPTFAGATSLVPLDATRAQVCWDPATDDLTAAGAIVYDVWTATAPGAEDFLAAPRTTSAAGGTCVTLDALSPNENACVVVRARDAAGNRDANVIERCAVMPAVPAGCVDYATQIQPLLDRNCVRCHSGGTAPQWLELDSYDNVLEGSARRTTVNACNAATSQLLNKISATPAIGDRMPRDGPPYLTANQIALVTQWVTQGAQRSCAEAANCADATRPTFAGAVSATAIDAETIRVCWNPATDAGTPAASLRYDLYEATAPGGQSYAQPAQHTVTNQTCHDIETAPNTRICTVVRARDRRGNVDQNVVEVCATTPVAGCAVEYADDVRPILSARCTHCHSEEAPPRWLDLTTRPNVLEGGALRDTVKACDWATSRINLKTAGASCGNRMPFDGPPWLAPSERATLQAWITTGARDRCADADPCGDVAAPVFGGISSALDVDGTTVQLCWNAATDAVTDPGSIRYDIWESRTPGGQNFGRPPSYAVAGGELCRDVEVPYGERLCWVVRARDLAGNRSANLQELCVTTAGACVDYAEMVNPIFWARCVHCHSGPGAPRGIRWDTYANAIADRGAVRPCEAANSDAVRITEDCDMPRDTMSAMCNITACLTPAEQRLIREWVVDGVPNACGSGGCP